MSQLTSEEKHIPFYYTDFHRQGWEKHVILRTCDALAAVKAAFRSPCYFLSPIY